MTGDCGTMTSMDPWTTINDTTGDGGWLEYKVSDAWVIPEVDIKQQHRELMLDVIGYQKRQPQPFEKPPQPITQPVWKPRNF